jgi:hypothetical protein
MAFLERPCAIPDGQFTGTVYGYIRDGQFADAIEVLRQQLEVRRRVGGDSRAAGSWTYCSVLPNTLTRRPTSARRRQVAHL